MKLTSQPAERNKQPILDVLRTALPKQGRVLEIASGTGQHVAFFAPQFPDLSWQPSDCDASSSGSIRAWVSECGSDNVREPVTLDVTADEWPVTSADAILCMNMVHISPWAASEGLFRGAGRLLPPGGLLFTYGPYKIDGDFGAEGNRRFDAYLREQDPSWGVRELRDLERLAHAAELKLERIVAMPANNHSLLWRRSGTGRS